MKYINDKCIEINKYIKVGKKEGIRGRSHFWWQAESDASSSSLSFANFCLCRRSPGAEEEEEGWEEGGRACMESGRREEGAGEVSARSLGLKSIDGMRERRRE